MEFWLGKKNMTSTLVGFLLQKVEFLLQKVEFLLKSRIHRYAKGTLAKMFTIFMVVFVWLIYDKIVGTLSRQKKKVILKCYHSISV